MDQRAAQRPAVQVATGSGVPAGQSGARQRTEAQRLENAAESSAARLAVSTRGQASDAQQLRASFAGSGPYVVVVQSASVAQSAPPAGVGVSVGVGVVGVSVGVGVGVGVGDWSGRDEQASARRSRAARRMAGGWQ
jgi:hypothetical protein